MPMLARGGKDMFEIPSDSRDESIYFCFEGGETNPPPAIWFLRFAGMGIQKE